MTSVPETRYVKSGDVHIAYQVIGDGPLDLVFVPGFFSNSGPRRDISTILRLCAEAT